MNIHLIDEFRRRTNASYDEARSYLERYNGDLLEAIVAFERERTGYRAENQARPHSSDFLNGLTRALQSLFDIKLVITDRNMKTYRVPIILPIVLCPIWHILIPAGIVLWFLGFKFQITREPDPNINVGSMVNRMKEKINEAGRGYQNR